MNYEQGAILLVPFPFTDLSSTKKRPVLVLSKTSDNLNNQDLVTCAVTSKTIKRDYGIRINKNSLKEGNLPIDSTILVSKLFTIGKSLIIKEFAKLSNSTMQQVQNLFCQITK